MMKVPAHATIRPQTYLQLGEGGGQRELCYDQKGVRHVSVRAVSFLACLAPSTDHDLDEHFDPHHRQPATTTLGFNRVRAMPL